VSNPPIEQAIHAHDPRKQVHLAPVISNFGEPEPGDLDGASARRWAICGGTALVTRSLRLFEQLHARIPEAFGPEHLDVVGGHDEITVNASFDKLRRTRPGLSCHYYPDVTRDLASEVLRRSAFGWLDYFGGRKVWPGMILKSGAFAALCAHAIVPILSHREATISLNGDSLPGPYYLTAEALNFPAPAELRDCRQKIYAWYHAHGDAWQLARVYAEALT
jgi:hypothetical protein